jgi:hypothetical protein
VRVPGSPRSFGPVRRSVDRQSSPSPIRRRPSNGWAASASPACSTGGTVSNCVFNAVDDPSRSGAAPAEVGGWIRLAIEALILGGGAAAPARSSRFGTQSVPPHTRRTVAAWRGSHVAHNAITDRVRLAGHRRGHRAPGEGRSRAVFAFVRLGFCAGDIEWSTLSQCRGY